MKYSLAIATVLALALLTALLWPQELKQAPVLTLKTIDGGAIDLEAMRGRPVLVTFWSTSCGICVKEIPHLSELYRELNPRGVEIIGVAMAYDPPHHVVAMAQRQQIPYPIVLDLDAAIAHAFGGVQATPDSFLIGPGGTIITHTVGMLDIAQLREQLESIL